MVLPPSRRLSNEACWAPPKLNSAGRARGFNSPPNAYETEDLSVTIPVSTTSFSPVMIRPTAFAPYRTGFVMARLPRVRGPKQPWRYSRWFCMVHITGQRAFQRWSALTRPPRKATTYRSAAGAVSAWCLERRIVLRREQAEGWKKVQRKFFPTPKRANMGLFANTCHSTIHRGASGVPRLATPLAIKGFSCGPRPTGVGPPNPQLSQLIFFGHGKPRQRPRSPYLPHQLVRL